MYHLSHWPYIHCALLGPLNCKKMRHLVFVAICGTVALVANASMPLCIVVAVGLYLLYACARFFS